MIHNTFDPENLKNNEEAQQSNLNSDAAGLNEEDFECESEDENMYDDDYDPMEVYGTSGEKYGWYNGYSDDVIDDAFEGDPENTWNVD